MQKAKFKPTEIEYVRCNDNYWEIKHFCGDSATITFEVCSVDDYILVTVFDSIRGKNICVPNGGYIIKLDEKCYTVVYDETTFKNFFEEMSIDA